MTNQDISQYIERIKKKQILTQREFKNVTKKVIELLVQESTVVPVKAPVTICGDIHGQFFDLLQLFNKGGAIPDTSYIFLGDYVDRGYNSVQTIQLLLCYKLMHSNRITLLRGNHESRQITSTYGFYEQIMRKYGNPNPWKFCNQLFDYLPLGAVIQGKIFCIHGGLSPDIKTIDQIRTIERKQEIPHQGFIQLLGPFCDLMWSDPCQDQSWQKNGRGAGWLFGWKVVNHFNEINGLQLIARAHQLVNQGHMFWFKKQNLVTIWSAPNYCYRCNNIASIMKVQQNTQNRVFIDFNATSQSAKSEHYRTLMPYFL